MIETSLGIDPVKVFTIALLVSAALIYIAILIEKMTGLSSTWVGLVVVSVLATLLVGLSVAKALGFG
jgi:hypothetical protein